MPQVHRQRREAHQRVGCQRAECVLLRETQERLERLEWSPTVVRGWPTKVELAKVELAKVELAKVELAKVELAKVELALASPTLANSKCLVLLWPVLFWPTLGQQQNSIKKPKKQH